MFGVSGTIDSPRTLFARLVTLWPFVLGIALARSTTLVVSYGSYVKTDEGLLTDGGTLVVLVFFALALIVFTRVHLGKRSSQALAFTCISLNGVCLLGLFLFEITGLADDASRFALAVAVSFFSMFTVCYWLRRLCGMSPFTVAGVILLALMVSEIEILFFSTLAVPLSYALVALLILPQYFCIFKSWSRNAAFVSPTPPRADEYFGYAKTFLSKLQIIIVVIAGIGLLAIVVGVFRGYPSGESIAFTPGTRIAYLVLTLAILTTLLFFLLKGKKHVMSLGIWTAMQALAGLAILTYAAFPNNLEIGAVFTTTLNAIMVGFGWYAIVAVMGYGKRDPFFYAVAGHIIWLGCRATARTSLAGAYSILGSDTLIAVIVGALLLFSTQVILIQYIFITSKASRAKLEKTMSHKTALEKAMGLEEDRSLSDVRRSYMSHSAEEIGEQFLLSEREIEVLTLYALGMTQKRVAEELHISQGTVHTHIKRIYAKTGIHSRQALLDYIKQHTT